MEFIKLKLMHYSMTASDAAYQVNHGRTQTFKDWTPEQVAANYAVAGLSDTMSEKNFITVVDNRLLELEANGAEFDISIAYRYAMQSHSKDHEIVW